MSFSAEGYAANQAAMRQAAGMANSAQLGAVPADTPRMEQLLNMAGSLAEMSGVLATRMDSLDARLLGAMNAISGDKASAPQPVRSQIDELQWRLEAAHKQIQRGFDAINRLERL